MSGDNIAVSGVSDRYAAALFNLIVEGSRDSKAISDNLKKVCNDLTSLKKILEDNKELRELVISPIYSRSEQVAAVTALAKKAGLGEAAYSFIGLIAENRRLSNVGGIIEAFDTRIARYNGEVSAEVTSAYKLNAESVKVLKSNLKDIIGRDVNLSVVVDPDVIGGLIVKVGSRMVDNSIRTRMQNMKIAMKEVG